MRILRLLLAFSFSGLGLSATLAQPAAVFPSLDSLVPARPITAARMELLFSARARELALRMQQNLAPKADWMRTYVEENAKPGKPLPYHENFGITKAEYDEILSAARNPTLQKVSDLPFSATKSGSIIELQFPSDDPTALPIRVDLDKQSITTPFGAMASPEKRDSGPNGGALGPHESYTWQLTEDSAPSGSFTSVQVVFGRILNSGQTFFRYTVRKITNHKPEIDFDTLLYYSPPK